MDLVDRLQLERFNTHEIEILTLIANGLSNREIAARLHLSQETVKWYNKQIFTKLGVNSRTQAVYTAKKRGLIKSESPTFGETRGLPPKADRGEPFFANSERYQLEQELGRGGMGVVYRAVDTLLNREVAVKILSGEVNEGGTRRLLREAQSAARLNHPNIVSVYDVGEIQGQPFVVMELVEGESLYTHKSSNIEEVIQIALQICAALEHAHAQGIIHRDLKPENILLTRQGVVKLLDFGLARSLASRISKQGAIVGSVFYLAPEQALGKEVDGRADLYSLGVIIYELASGQLPFSGEDPLAVISQHLYAPAAPPSIHRGMAAPLDTFILKLLSKNPDERFSSAGQAAEALQRIRGEGKPGEAGRKAQLLDQLVRGRMIGRRDELETLRELWERAVQGSGQLALISGEPGIGKTRLANEFMVFAQLNDAVVLYGGCYEYEAATPYLPFVEAFRRWVHSQAPEPLAALLGNTASEIARLAPEIESKLGSLAPNPPLSANEERLRLFDHIARFLQNLAKGKGLLLFIDDLHWADQGTLSLLYYLLRNLRSEPVLILATYREIELDRAHPLAAALVEWNRERLATRLPLDRLSQAETGALLAILFGQESISEDLTQAMHAETEGNPFFLEEVVKALIEQGQIFRENNRWEQKDIAELAIPQSVKEAIGRRLNRLTQTSLDMLHTAAAIGKEFDFEELAAASQLSEDQLLDGLDEAEVTQLLRREKREFFSFTHDKIREVLYEELNPIRRKRLHQRIGEGLERRYAADVGAHAQELAHHFTLSGDLPQSLRYSLIAAEKSRLLFALDEAVRYYEVAREAAEMLKQPEQLAKIYRSMGEIYSHLGPVSEAVEYFELAIKLEPDPRQRAAIKALIGTLYTHVGDERGLRYIEEALQELDSETQASEVALGTAMIGRYYHYRARHLKAIEYLEQARALAEPLDDAPTLTSIYAYLSGAHQHLTHFEESMNWAKKNIELGRRKELLNAEANGVEFLAEDYYAIGSWQEALEYTHRDREIGEHIGAQDHVAWAYYASAKAEHGLGNLATAEEHARKSRLLAENLGDSRLKVLTCGLRAQISADLGKYTEASRLASQALQEADELHHVVLQSSTRHDAAYCSYQEGDISRAMELYTQAETLIRPTENKWIPMTFRPWMAQVLLETGRISEAASTAENALELARASRSRHDEARALCTQAQIHAASGKWEEAFTTIQESVSIFDNLGSKLELGRAWVRRGEMRRATGSLLQAEEDWKRALVLFEQIGAEGEARKMRAGLDLAPLA